MKDLITAWIEQGYEGDIELDDDCDNYDCQTVAIPENCSHSYEDYKMLENTINLAVLRHISEWLETQTNITFLTEITVFETQHQECVCPKKENIFFAIDDDYIF